MKSRCCVLLLFSLFAILLSPASSASASASASPTNNVGNDNKNNILLITRDNSTNHDITKTPKQAENNQVPSSISLPLIKRQISRQVWAIPFVVGAGSYWGFRTISLNFHALVQWASSNKWIPDTEEAVNLQTNIVTQVVNGPVITSVSILFATLASMTISNLYNRQVDIRKSFSMEVQILRQLQTILKTLSASSGSCKVVSNSNNNNDLILTGEELIEQYIKQLIDECHQAPSQISPDDPHLTALLTWCIRLFSPASILSIELLSHLHSYVLQLIEQRQIRSLSLSSVFPVVHWVTLTFLAISIAISFLVATDQNDEIFLEGLQVRILWSLLIGSFTSLAVLCFDLSKPFGGAYQISSSEIEYALTRNHR